jgi:hypothetical protein
MMINQFALAFTLGALLGLSYFFLTIFHIFRGRGPIIHFMGHHLKGYRRNFKGAIVSFVWGVVIGFTTGFLIASVYNFINNYF